MQINVISQRQEKCFYFIIHLQTSVTSCLPFHQSHVLFYVKVSDKVAEFVCSHEIRFIWFSAGLRAGNNPFLSCLFLSLFVTSAARLSPASAHPSCRSSALVPQLLVATLFTSTDSYLTCDFKKSNSSECTTEAASAPLVSDFPPDFGLRLQGFAPVQPQEHQWFRMIRI